jgi:hypothetical protein
MLAAKSRTFNSLGVAVSEVEVWEVGEVGDADVDNSWEEQVVCFESFGMHVCLFTWNTGAISSRVFGTARRLPSLVRSIRKSFRICS